MATIGTAVLTGLGTAAVARILVDSGRQSFVTGGELDGALP